MPEYSYSLDNAELARYDAMAARALAHEASLWDKAGIVSGAAVVDLGCGPGAFLAALAARIAPSGTVVGVDESGYAVAAAQTLVDQRDLGESVRIVHAGAHRTGLQPASVDVVFIRNLLVHNGPGSGAILDHARRLLRPGGHLLCVEPDVAGLHFPERAVEEQELEQRWLQMMRSMGNDPGLGAEGRLTKLISTAGFVLDSAVQRVDPLAVERSPAWTARQMMLDSGFATNADVARWDTAITTRLRQVGLLACRLPVTVVVAHPAPNPAASATPASPPATKGPPQPQIASPSPSATLPHDPSPPSPSAAHPKASSPHAKPRSSARSEPKPSNCCREPTSPNGATPPRDLPRAPAGTAHLNGVR
jgi:SAM-dependent methyltransferase